MTRWNGALLGLLVGGVLLATPHTANAWEIGGCFASFCGTTGPCSWSKVHDENVVAPDDAVMMAGRVFRLFLRHGSASAHEYGITLADALALKRQADLELDWHILFDASRCSLLPGGYCSPAIQHVGSRFPFHDPLQPGDEPTPIMEVMPIRRWKSHSTNYLFYMNEIPATVTVDLKKTPTLSRGISARDLQSTLTKHNTTRASGPSVFSLDRPEITMTPRGTLVAVSPRTGGGLKLGMQHDGEEYGEKRFDGLKVTWPVKFEWTILSGAENVTAKVSGASGETLELDWKAIWLMAFRWGAGMRPPGRAGSISTWRRSLAGSSSRSRHTASRSSHRHTGRTSTRPRWARCASCR